MLNHPMDRLGRPYTPMMLPEQRRGQRPANAGRTYPPEVYTGAELDALMRAAGRGYAGKRMRALIVVMWRCGLRVAEALALELRDLDFEHGTVTVRHGKGNRRRVVGIDDQAAAVVQVWLTARAELHPPRRSRVFCTITKGNVGAPWQYPQVAERLRELGEKAGLEKRVHAHGFRHTYAVELLREGVNALHIMKALGHADLETTMRYLDHLMPGEVVAVLRARSWAVPLAA